MNHYASTAFWAAYEALPERVRKLADKHYELLKKDPQASVSPAEEGGKILVGSHRAALSGIGR